MDKGKIILLVLLLINTVCASFIQIALKENSRIVYLGELSRSGEFVSAIFSPTVKIDSIGEISWDHHGDSLRLVGIYNRIDVKQLFNCDSTSILDSVERKVNFQCEFSECIEFVNFISLNSEEIPGSNSELLFTTKVKLATSAMLTFDTIAGIAQFELIDSLTETQKDEITKYGGRVDSFHHFFTKGKLVELPRWGIRDYRFENGPEERCGTRVIFFNDKKVWPQENCFFYNSHASGAGIECAVFDFYPWYEWNGNLFTFTISYEPHRVVASVLVVNDNTFHSYTLFDQQPDCG